MKIKGLITLVASSIALMTASGAHANLQITYYTISPTDPDINHLAGGSFNNEVQNALGPNGLPVLNTATFGCVSNCFTAAPLPTDVTAGGELTWWSPTLNSHVTQTGTANITLPFSVPSNFFPPNGTGSSDANGYQAAVLSGTLNVPTTETVSFTIGADDAAFAFLDGTVVCDLGGVHGFSPGTCVTPFQISAGAHTINVFFDDLNAVQSGLSFSVITQGVTTTPPPPPPSNGVPEPGSLALFGITLIGLLATRRKSV